MEFNLTLIGQMITFALLVWFTMKYVWPPIITALRERQAKIAEGLAAAEQGAQAEEAAAIKAEETIKEARQQAQEIIRQAERRATEIVEESKTSAREEGERILTAARAEIDQESNRAREQLRGQVADIAVRGASRVLGKEVDLSSHSKMLDELVGQL